MNYLFLIFFVACQASEEFHTFLNKEDFKHYFGTHRTSEVPHYQFVSPEFIQTSQNETDFSKEYLLNAFGVNHHLHLVPYLELVSPACIVQRISTNSTLSLEPCVQGEESCHFHGYIKNNSQSSAAVSTCNGLHGIISLPEHDLVIQPVKEHHLSLIQSEHSHVLYKRSPKKSSCSIRGVETVKDIRPVSRRRKRSAGQYLEVKAVVAPDAAKYHGADTRQFVTTVLNVAAQRYLDPSLGYKLYLTLVDLLILEDEQEDFQVDVNVNSLLTNFCQWQGKHHPAEDSHPRHADHVLLITQADLEDHGNSDNVGLAYTGTVCSQDHQCSVNEDDGLNLGLTISHEIGHSLNMKHDGQGNDCDSGSYIMAPGGIGSLKWSRCSAKSLEDFMSSSRSSCLEDAPFGSATKLYGGKDKPGMFYSADKQCQMALFTENTQYYSGPVDCSALKCHEGRQTKILGTPLIDGTECGNRKWCIEGKCVPMGAGSPGPINGGWSSWTPEWTDCSRTCGGGVKMKTRKCNNPEPRYGGRDCAGEEMTAMICNLQVCPTSQYKFKEEQCSATNDQPYHGQKYQWLPIASYSDQYACRLLCRKPGGNTGVPRGSGKYIDGTECLGKTTLGRCLSGKCEDFGCDGHHGSGLMFDKCGVCNGRSNTCQEHRGTYNKGKANEYVTFVTIPRGSTGIIITQSNQFCHLSVQVNGKRLFSEDGNQKSKSGVYSHDGVRAKYNGQGPEKIEISGPIPANVDVQVWRDYGDGYTGVEPDVTYIYHTPRGRSGSDYKWVKTPGACSQTCGHGWSVPDIKCVQSSNNRPVDDLHCNIFSKPEETKEACNPNPCPPVWYPEKWHACTRSCGGGEQRRSVECTIFQHGNHVPVGESHCSGQRKPSTTRNCNVNPCPGEWKAEDWSCCSRTCGKGVKTRQVKCYASVSSNQPITEEKCLANQKPTEQEACMEKPCDTSLSGSSCTDKATDCSDYGGGDVCYGQFESWAKENCKEYCGLCVKDPNNFKPDNCKDKADCASYGANVCSDYEAWSKENCQRTCNHCPESRCSSQSAPIGESSVTSGSSCSDKISDCADYGANVCTEYGQWAKENCQKHCKYCQDTAKQVTEKPAQSACSDKISDCADYGENVCTAYGGWAKENCQKHCNFCSGVQAVVPVTTTPTPETCADAVSDCAEYGANVCTEYGGWAKTNCQKHCNFCQELKKETSKVDNSATCSDIVQCADYGASVCQEYAGWSKENCPKFCNLCKTESSCTDKLSDCADYGKSACTDYGDWAKENCQKFCNFCGTRRRRSVQQIQNIELQQNGERVEKRLPGKPLKNLNRPLSAEDMHEFKDDFSKSRSRIDSFKAPPKEHYDVPKKPLVSSNTDTGIESMKAFEKELTGSKPSSLRVIEEALNMYLKSHHYLTAPKFGNELKLFPEIGANNWENQKSESVESLTKKSNNQIEEESISKKQENEAVSNGGDNSNTPSSNLVTMEPIDTSKDKTKVDNLIPTSSGVKDNESGMTENVPEVEGGPHWIEIPDPDMTPVDLKLDDSDGKDLLDEELDVLNDMQKDTQTGNEN